MLLLLYSVLFRKMLCARASLFQSLVITALYFCVDGCWQCAN